MTPDPLLRNRPIHLGPPIRRIRIVRWIGDVRLPRRTAWPDAVRFHPALHRHIGFAELIVEAAVHRDDDRSARQRRGFDGALARSWRREWLPAFDLPEARPGREI